MAVGRAARRALETRDDDDEKDALTMRIGFDVSQTAESMAGCGIVAAELCRALAEVAVDDEIVPYPVFGNYRNPAYRKAVRPASPNVRALHHDMSLSALNAGWDAADDRHAFLGAPDIVHANNFSCPRRLGAPLVYTLYDLGPIEHPEFHTEANRLVCFNGMFDASLYADAFVAISSFTRDRFLHWFPHVDPARVTVVRLAARFGLTAAGGDDAAVLARHGVAAARFWLAVGTIEPRKNYGLLIDAYARLVQDTPDAPPLCIAGQAGWKETMLAERIERAGLADRVRCLGFVPDEDLAALYRHTTALVFTSHYEGFGLPLIEAQACGAPVIAVRSSSVPEVVGNAALLTPPDAPAVTAAMQSLLAEPGRRRALRDAALAQSARSSWREAARTTLEVYRATVKRAASTTTAVGPATSTASSR
jgi:glycosyltransferase involved in cell wall biosynthesis